MAGILAVLILIRIARRMFRSTVLGCAAGLLMALDGFHLVLSRTALLDIFLLFFILAAFGCLVLDRDPRRRALAARDGRRARSDPAGRAGRPAWLADVPWWRLAAGVMLGCALRGQVERASSSSRSSRLLVLFWEVGAPPHGRASRARGGTRSSTRSAGRGARRARWRCATWPAGPAGSSPTTATTGTTCADHGPAETPVIGALQNLFHYHTRGVRIPRRTDPRTRTSRGRGSGCCSAGRSRSTGRRPAPAARRAAPAEILLLGTPVLWWSFLPALVGTVWFGIARRDWRAGAILARPSPAGLLPWFWYELDGRTMFYFYAAPARAVPDPGGGLRARRDRHSIRHPGSHHPDRPPRTVRPGTGRHRRTPHGTARQWTARQWTAARRRRCRPVSELRTATGRQHRVGAYVLLVALCFAYFYPINPLLARSFRTWTGRPDVARRPLDIIRPCPSPIPPPLPPLPPPPPSPRRGRTGRNRHHGVRAATRADLGTAQRWQGRSADSRPSDGGVDRTGRARGFSQRPPSGWDRQHGRCLTSVP